MKPTQVLTLCLTATLTIGDNSTETTQHTQWSHGQIKLTKFKTCWFWKLHCTSKFKLEFYESMISNESQRALVNGMADTIECNTCKFNPNDKESCSREECDLLHFDCLWKSLVIQNNSLPLLSSVNTSHTIYPTTTANNRSPVQSVGHCNTLKTALEAITALLVLLVVLLITGWVWTCWILKKRGISFKSDQTEQSERSNRSVLFLYETNLLNKEASTEELQSSATYSLLTHDNETTQTTKREGEINRKEAYSTLDGCCGKAETTTPGPGQKQDGYSTLFSN